MKMNERYDGSDSPFDGDRTLIWRSLPANARVTKASVLLTPGFSTVGELFEEMITFTGGQGNWGATKTTGTGFVEVDFHSRRTLASVIGKNINEVVAGTPRSHLQVDLGGSVYMEINDKGALRSPNDALFSLKNDGKLPSLKVNKFKFTQAPSNTAPLDVTQVTIRSVPTNVSVRLGNLPPFWTHLGELTVEDTSPDFAAVLQAFLAGAKEENGFYNVPLILHTDGIARLQITLVIEYQIEASVMPQGLDEVQLPYDFDNLPKAQEDVLQLAVPVNMRVAPGGVTARVRGAFDETRIYGQTGAVTPAGAVEISPAMSQAQMISLPETLKASAFDLFMVVTQAAKLQLDLCEDLDGKPGSGPLLPRPVKVELSAPVGTVQDRKSAGELRWISVVLPAEFQFQKDQRYWLVLQSLEGQAGWNATPAAAGIVGMQHTKDGGLSWRDTIVAGISGAASAFFRLRQKPERFKMPIELQVGSGKQAIRVSLDRFQPLGRVDFALDFDEIGEAFNQYLDKSAPVACPETEHLVNGDFEQWLRLGDKPMPPTPLSPLSVIPSAVAVAPNGKWFYVAGKNLKDPDSALVRIIGVPCDEIKDQGIELTAFFPNIVVISPDGTRAYLADSTKLQVIDTITHQTLGVPLDLGEGKGQVKIKALALSPDGGRLYVAEYFPASSNLAGSILTIDTTKLEKTVIKSAPKLDDVIVGTPPDIENLQPMALAVSPDGTRMYVVANHNKNQGEVRIFDTDTLRQFGDPIVVGIKPSAIALTSDGKWAMVANEGSNSISIIDTARGVVVGSNIPLGGSPKALGISPEGSRAYVAIVAQNSSASKNTDIVLSAIDLTRRAVVNTMTVFKQTKIGMPLSVTLALTPQGDKIYVAHEESGSISSVQIGERLPAEWNLTAGQVALFCLPDHFHLIAVLGELSDLRGKGTNSSPSSLSQIVSVAESCPYEFSFYGIATDADALAEVLWIGKDCGLLQTDQVPIQAFVREAVGDKLNALTRAVSAAAPRPRLVLHRARLTAPVGAEQAEVRFNVPKGVAAGIDQVSLIATNETVVNADLSLQHDGRVADWTLSPGVAPGVSLIAVAEGIQLRNAGAETVELVQALSIKGNAPLTLEFQGQAIMRSSAQANPRIELRWLKADKSAAGPATVLEILSTGLGSTLGSGTSPNDATHVEIHLVVHVDTTLEIKRISLRFSVPTLVPVTFVAQAPGELTVSNFRVAFEQAKVATPPIPAKGLCTSTPPGRRPGETPGDRCFCMCCETEQTMTENTSMETRSGRPALVGHCVGCGGYLVRFGGQRVPDAQPFSLRWSGVSRPIVLHPIAPRVVTTTEGRLKAEMPATMPLTAINGIGEVRARRLVMIGIDSIEKLATAVPEDVAKALEAVSLEKAAEFIEIAKQLLVSAKKT